MRRRRGVFLCFDVNCEAGLEFHGEAVGKDGGLLDGFLQFFVPGYRPGSSCRRYYSFCDALLHLPEETVAIGEYPIEGLDRDLLQ